jgi:nitrite reductase/ring-hydroxylating ferredoxin subunit
LSDFLDVAALEDVPENGTLSIRLPTGEQVCLVRCGDAVGALLDQCSHQAMPLSAGEVLPDCTIQCAWHGARFDCRTGEVRDGPATEGVAAFDVRVENGRILVGRVKVQE